MILNTQPKPIKLSFFVFHPKCVPLNPTIQVYCQWFVIKFLTNKKFKNHDQNLLDPLHKILKRLILHGKNINKVLINCKERWYVGMKIESFFYMRIK
jgi:hypothetical protein